MRECASLRDETASPTARAGVLSLVLSLSAAMTNCSHPQSSMQQRVTSSTACFTGRQHIASIADGQVLHIEPNAIAPSPERVLVLGSPVLAWNSVRGSGTDVREVRAAGVMMDSNGRSSFVPLPTTPNGFSAPRAIHQRGLGWHVIWAPTTPDSAQPRTISYAVFNGAQWSEPIALASFDQILWREHLPSNLVALPTGYLVAVPIRDQKRTNTVALYQLEDGKWHELAAPSTSGALYVSLEFVNGIIVLAYVGYGPLGENGLFATRSSDYGKTWSAPTNVARGRAYDPRIIATGGENLTLIWLAEEREFQPVGLHAAISSDLATTWSQPRPIPNAGRASAFAALPMTGGGALLLAQTGEGRRRMQQLLTHRDSTFNEMSRDSVDAATVPILFHDVIRRNASAMWSRTDSTSQSVYPYTVLSEIAIPCSR